MRDHSLVPGSLLALALALAAGCTNGYPAAPEATPSPISGGAPGTPTTGGSPTPIATASPGGPPGEIEIEIRGGPYAGSYRAVAMGGCDSKPDQNTFTVTYAEGSAPGDFVALRLVLRDAELALEDESDDFVAEISVGGAGAGVSYAIDPVNGAGSGSALLETSPFGATLDLSVSAPDGARIELSVICGSP